MKFLSPEVALTSINLSYGLAWNAIVVSGLVLLLEIAFEKVSPQHLEILDTLQKGACRTDCPSIAASLEPLAHCQNVTSLVLF